MYDFGQSAADEQLERDESPDYLRDLDRHWSPRLATRLAAEDGVELEEDHWLVIYCLRERFRTCGPDWSARELTRELEQEFSDVGGLRFLYQLFPRGPLVQACRFAGLPLPQGTLNASFGSVH